MLQTEILNLLTVLDKMLIEGRNKFIEKSDTKFKEYSLLRDDLLRINGKINKNIFNFKLLFADDFECKMRGLSQSLQHANFNFEQCEVIFQSVKKFVAYVRKLEENINSLRLFKQIKNIDEQNTLPVQPSHKGQRTVTLINKPRKYSFPNVRDSVIWYWKPSSVKSTMRELISQELRRFFNNSQPKTRVGYATNHEIGILSKEVPDFRSYAEIFANNFAIPALFNAGEAYLISLFLREDDLNYSNIGINKNGNVVVIDGNLTLDPTRKNLSESDILKLPMVLNYYPHNWLSVVKKSKYTYEKMNKAERDTPVYQVDQKNVFYGILKILTLSPAFFTDFLNHYLNINSTEPKRILRTLLSGQSKLRTIMQNNPHFRAYLNGQGSYDIQNYALQTMGFVFTEKTVITSVIPNLINTIYENFRELIAIPAYILRSIGDSPNENSLSYLASSSSSSSLGQLSFFSSPQSGSSAATPLSWVSPSGPTEKTTEEEQPTAKRMKLK